MKMEKAVLEIDIDHVRGMALQRRDDAAMIANLCEGILQLNGEVTRLKAELEAAKAAPLPVKEKELP